MKLYSRKEARLAGLQFYCTGRPCKRGHISHRRMSGACIECDILYTENNKDRRRFNERARYAKNPEKHINKVKKQYAKNGDAIRKRRREYHYKVYVNPEVREAAAKRTKEWALKNPERARAGARNGKQKRKNVPGKHTAQDISVIMKMQNGKCAYCKVRLGKKYHVDHITPVSKGGTNDRQNIQLTCADCNLTKGARDPIFHAQTLGMLL